ncbi:putative methyltransferase PMT5-like [Hibiscus syriacus]|uniref:Methyltransferase PMT5-like n=1 Tax=Hibiscus syriacus TaxID=106335 RepID=A0A6A3BRX4_HIBSY|nr:putative methyltransferase PMT5-like [Hibiscus syriacus]
MVKLYFQLENLINVFCAGICSESFESLELAGITYIWRASPLCTLWSDGIPAEEVCSASCSSCFVLIPSSDPSVVVGHCFFCILLSIAKCCPSLDRHFSPDEVLQLLDRFYNLEVLKPDDEGIDILNHEEDFCLPQSYFVKEEP